MVRTRTQARGFLFGQLSQEQRYQLEELVQQSHSQSSQLSSSSQSSHGSQGHSFEYNSFDHNESYPEPTRRQTTAAYKESDNCRRHALPDERSKDVQVISYRRRKPY